MKFHEVVEQFIDAKRELEEHEDSEFESMRDNAKTRELKSEKYEESAKELDNAYELLIKS